MAQSLGYLYDRTITEERRGDYRRDREDELGRLASIARLNLSALRSDRPRGRQKEERRWSLRTHRQRRGRGNVSLRVPILPATQLRRLHGERDERLCLLLRGPSKVKRFKNGRVQRQVEGSSGQVDTPV